MTRPIRPLLWLTCACLILHLLVLDWLVRSQPGLEPLRLMNEPAFDQSLQPGQPSGNALPLPDAQTLDRIAYRTTIFAFPVFGFGVIFGAIWAEGAWGRYWGWDPKETVSFIAWIVYAAYLHARSTAGWRDYKAAWINVAGFVAMIFNLFFVNLVTVGLHSYAGI